MRFVFKIGKEVLSKSDSGVMPKKGGTVSLDGKDYKITGVEVVYKDELDYDGSEVVVSLKK